jgi:hypothetical protein
MKVDFSRQGFKNYSKTNFNENPSSESRIVPCRLRQGADTSKLIVSFSIFAKSLIDFSSIIGILILSADVSLYSYLSAIFPSLTKWVSLETRIRNLFLNGNKKEI